MQQPLTRHIANAVTGDQIEFLQSPLMGDSDLLVFRSTLPALAQGAPLHSHAGMIEIFEVEYGALEIDLGGGQLQLLGPGERIGIPPGTPHGFRNPLDSETRFLNISTPGLELEKFLRTMFGLANEGKTNAAGMPTDPRAMAIALHSSDIIFSGASARLQKMLVGLLARLARWTGVEARVTRHWRAGSAR